MDKYLVGPDKLKVKVNNSSRVKDVTKNVEDLNSPNIINNVNMHKTEKVGKLSDVLNTDLAKSYLRDIEIKTGRKIDKKQLRVLKESLRGKN